MATDFRLATSRRSPGRQFARQQDQLYPKCTLRRSQRAAAIAATAPLLQMFLLQLRPLQAATAAAGRHRRSAAGCREGGVPTNNWALTAWLLVLAPAQNLGAFSDNGGDKQGVVFNT